MVVSRLQNGLINSRIAPRTSRLNCQNIFFQMGLHTFFSNSDIKKITLTFETNDEHQAKSYQNTLRYNVITKLR
jgi:hypothetical protein